MIKAPAEFDCKTCKARHCDESGELPGSIGPAPFELFIVENPTRPGKPLISSNTCLLPKIDAATWYLFRLHSHYKNSVLLVAGGIMDQPNKYIATMDLITEVIADG